MIIKVFTLTALFFTLSIQTTFAGSFPNNNFLSKIKKIEKKSINLHPFISSFKHPASQLSIESQRAINSLRIGTASLSQSMDIILKEKINNPAIMIHSSNIKNQFSNSMKSYFLNGSRKRNHSNQSLSYTYSLNGVPFCGLETKAHHMSDGSLAVLGQIPEFDENSKAVPLESWPKINKALQIIEKKLQEDGLLSSNLKTISKNRCYGIENSNLMPLWNFVVRTGDRSYQILSDHQDIYSFQALFFDLDEPVEGKIQAYVSNPAEGSLKTFTTTLTGNTTLTSIYFKTKVVPDSTVGPTFERARSSTHEFIYEPDHDDFPEASVFIHATNMHSYFQTLGFEWDNSEQMLLKIHAVLSGNKNNALYEPGIATSTGNPSISIGDGDGIGLQNLPLDADVVSHELGHHIVFKTLTQTTGEALVLHEALADYFAFARTGDTCLGESICPEDSGMCMLPTECLRTADITFTYDSDEYKQMGPHLKGQLFSSLLWNLRDSVGASEVTSLVFKSLEYLVHNSGFSEFFVSLLLADKELNDGSNACAIIDGAHRKNLGKFVEAIDCNNSDTWVMPTASSSSGSSETSSSDQKSDDDGGLFSCGTIANSKQQSNNTNWALYFLYFSPLFSLALFQAFIKYKAKAL